jgi:hypothetical protein
MGDGWVDNNLTVEVPKSRHKMPRCLFLQTPALAGIWNNSERVYKRIISASPLLRFDRYSNMPGLSGLSAVTLLGAGTQGTRLAFMVRDHLPPIGLG